MKRLYSVNFICLCVFVFYVHLPLFKTFKKMKRIIVSAYILVSFAFFVTSCTNYVDCTCAYDLENEVVDSVLWNAAGQPIYLKSGSSLPQEKTYIRDTVSATGDCSSLNYYDQVGIDYPNVGLRLHAIVNCWEK